MKLFREDGDMYIGVAPKNTFDPLTGRPLKAGEPCWAVVEGRPYGTTYTKDYTTPMPKGFWFKALTFIGFGRHIVKILVRRNQHPSNTKVVDAIAMQKYLSACRNNPT